MKFYKLVKSIDYVTYPSYVELQKINKSLSDSFSNVKSAFWSAFLALVLDGTFISKWLVENFCSTSKSTVIVAFSKQNNASTILAVAIAFLIYVVIHSIRFIKSRWGSNKKTVEARNIIVSRFYRMIIPNFIALKSIVQQHDESIKRSELRHNKSDMWDQEKRYLLLLQANYEVCELINELNNLSVIEVTKTKIMTGESLDVLEHIGKDVYFTVLLDLLTIAHEIMIRVSNCKGKEIDSTLKTIRAVVSSSKAINVCKHLENYTLCKKISLKLVEIEKFNTNTSE